MIDKLLKAKAETALGYEGLVDVKVRHNRFGFRVEYNLIGADNHFVFGSQTELMFDHEIDGIVFSPLGGMGSFKLDNKERIAGLRLQNYVVENWEEIIEIAKAGKE